jgi:hypothetical protein
LSHLPSPLESRTAERSPRLPFQGLTGPEWDRLLSAATALACALYAGWILAVGVYQGWGNDFLHYWISNRTWIQGGNPYIALLPVEGDFHARTVFPLWMLLPFWPLSHLPYQVAVRCFLILNGACLAGALFVLKRLMLPSLAGWRWHLVVLLAIWLSVPALYSAQTSILVALLLALSLTLLETRRPLPAGVMMALTLIKPHILFVNWMMLPLIAWLQGQRRFLLGLVGSVGLIVGISAALLPGWWQPYLAGDFSWIVTLDQRGGTVLWPKSTLLEWTPLVLGWQGWPLYALYGALAVGLAILVGHCITTYRDGQLSLPTLAAVGVVASLLLVPYAREYDYSILILPLMSMVALSRKLGRASSLAVALGLLAVVGIHLYGGPQPWAYFTPLGMGLLLAGLILAYTHKQRHKIEAVA